MGYEVTLPPPNDENSYPLLRVETDSEMRDLQGNLEPGGINPLDLPYIKVPSGGAPAFTEKTPDGEESRKEIIGIIGAAQNGRLFWRQDINEGGGRKPPDCVSRNGSVGEGDPGGECAKCRYSQFGSAPRGHGQACKQIRQMLVLQPGSMLPNLLTVPATSLQNCSRYFLMLFSRKLPFWGVVTKLALEKATNQDGIVYAKILFSIDRTLNGVEREGMKRVQEQMKRWLDPVAFESILYAMNE